MSSAPKMPSTFTYEKRGKIAIMTINRPDAHNAFTAEMLRAMDAAFADFNDDDDLWVAIDFETATREPTSACALGVALIDGLEVVEEITMIAAPDLMGAYKAGVLDDRHLRAAQLALIAHCETMGDRVALIDAPPGLSPQHVAAWRRDTAGYDSKYAALYYPWIELTGIDGRSPMDFTVGFQMAPGGRATASGTVDPAGPSVAAELEATDVALTSLQPYLDPYVTLKLESALASVKGNLRYGLPGEAAKAAFAGNFGLNGLRLVDPAASKPYLSVDAVRLPRFSLTLQPNGLKAQEIRISRPVGRNSAARGRR